MSWRVACGLLWGAAILPGAGIRAGEPAKVDPFEESLRVAVNEYRAGNLDKAREALAQASGVLEEARSRAVTDTFPDPPTGWKVGEVERAEIPGFLGGGQSIKRTYAEAAGHREMVLEVIRDSGFGKLLTGVLANDATAESQGFQVRRVGGNRALFKASQGGGELSLPLDERILVKITGKGGAGEKELLAFARDLDCRGLKRVK